MREADEEIREIKKEIIESRGLIIKTNNLVNALGADIKSIAKRQAGYERRFNLNSAAAYFIIAALSFVGLKLVSDARIREIESRMTELEREKNELARELRTLTETAEKRRRAEEAAGRFYDIIRQQRRQEVVNGYATIAQETLSRAEGAFFRDIHDQFRMDLSIQAYQAGLSLLRAGRYAEAAEKLQESMRLRDDAAHVPAVKYNLGVTLRHLGRPGEAMVFARQVVEQNVDRELQDDATWLLSGCAEDLQDYDTAMEALRTLIRRWPRSTYATNARPHLRDLILASRRGPN